jgi:uncharacterized protein YndB with AHSA1/START domain
MAITTIEIAKPIDQVWQILLDTDHWEKWNPAQKLEIEFPEINGHGTVLEITDKHEWIRSQVTFTIVDEIDFMLQWKWGLPYVLNYYETFQLIKLDDSMTRVVHSRVYYGILHIFPHALTKDVVQRFSDGLMGLKRYFEIL